MKWLVIGHYGGHNTGDEAMLVGFISAALRVTNDEFIIATKTETTIPFRNHNRIDVVNSRFDVIIRNVLDVSGVILGGGTHFHDDYLWPRLLRHYGYLIRLLLISLLARVMHKPVYWLGVGFGPFQFPLTIFLTKIGIKLCNYVTVRDVNSLTQISQITRLDNVDLTFDLAALMILEQTRNEPLRPKIMTKRIIGLSVLSMTNIVSATFDKQLFESISSALANTLRDKQYILRIFEIRGGNRESDVAISQKYYTHLISMFPDQVELIPYQDDPRLIMQQMKDCEAFIAMRFHAGLLAYLSGCRLLLLSYHPKVHDLAMEIGLHPESCIAIRERGCIEFIEAKIRDMMQGDTNFQARLPIQDALMLSVKNLAVIQKLKMS